MLKYNSTQKTHLSSPDSAKVVYYMITGCFHPYVSYIRMSSVVWSAFLRYLWFLPNLIILASYYQHSSYKDAVYSIT